MTAEQDAGYVHAIRRALANCLDGHFLVRNWLEYRRGESHWLLTDLPISLLTHRVNQIRITMESCQPVKESDEYDIAFAVLLTVHAANAVLEAHPYSVVLRGRHPHDGPLAVVPLVSRQGVRDQWWAKVNVCLPLAELDQGFFEIVAAYCGEHEHCAGCGKVHDDNIPGSDDIYLPVDAPNGRMLGVCSTRCYDEYLQNDRVPAIPSHGE